MKILAKGELFKTYDAQELLVEGLREGINSTIPSQVGYSIAVALPDKTIVVAVETENADWVQSAETNWLPGLLSDLCGDHPIRAFSVVMQPTPILLLGVVIEPEGFVHEAGLLARAIPIAPGLTEELSERLFEAARSCWGKHWMHTECLRHHEGGKAEGETS